jgi:hypothetical protein
MVSEVPGEGERRELIQLKGRKEGAGIHCLYVGVG